MSCLFLLLHSQSQTGQLGFHGEHVESSVLYSWKLNIDGRISFYCNKLDLQPPKLKFTFRHLKIGIQEFHLRFVVSPADKAANNAVAI